MVALAGGKGDEETPVAAAGPSGGGVVGGAGGAGGPVGAAGLVGVAGVAGVVPGDAKRADSFVTTPSPGDPAVAARCMVTVLTVA